MVRAASGRRKARIFLGFVGVDHVWRHARTGRSEAERKQTKPSPRGSSVSVSGWKKPAARPKQVPHPDRPPIIRACPRLPALVRAGRRCSGRSGIGWLIDRWLGSLPWGMFVFALLGFTAGVLNVMRQAGVAPGGPDPTTERRND